MGVDAQCEGRVAVAEVLSELLDGDAHAYQCGSRLLPCPQGQL
jgi:hypothetical protein